MLLKKSTINRSMLLILIAQCVIGLCTSAKADFEMNLRKWEYYKEIESGPASEYGVILVDKQIFEHAQDNLADLRIIDNNGKGRDVPYALMIASGSETETEQEARLLNKSIVQGKYTSFMLDLGKPGKISNKMGIDTPSINFTRKVEIEGSNNGLQWSTIRDDAYIFNFSHDYEASNTGFSFPDSTYRYYRVKIWDYDQKPIQVDNAIVQWKKVEPSREMLLFAGKGDTTQNSELKSTDIILDLGGKGIPSSRLRIDSTDSNYNREVGIAGSDDEKTWDFISEGDGILKITTPRVKANESVIGYPEAAYRYLRVRILNYDDNPLNISRISVYGIERSLTFRYTGANSYRLYYGNTEVETPPVYDFQHTVQYITSTPTKLTLGPETKNSSYSRPIRPWLEDNPWVIWVVLIAAMIFLGFLTIRLVIQTKSSSN